MKFIRSLVAIAALTLAALPASAQQFRLLSSWDQNYAYNPYLLEPFVKGVEEASNGRMKISVSGPETVAPFEQLEPVGSGVFDFLFTAGAYHFGTTPIMTVAEALEGDLETIRASGIFDVFDKHYQKYGLKLIMLPITPEGAYHIITREPVSADGDLQGRKIRGSMTYAGVVKMLGGALTVLPASQIYTGLEKGVVDGASWPIIGALEYRWYEVAKYLLRPGFGVNYEPFFMNLNAWNKLSAEDQALLMDVARKVEDSWFRDAAKVWKAEEEALLAKGMQITEMGEKQKSQLREAWSEGLWGEALKREPKATQELRDFARSKGLTE